MPKRFEENLLVTAKETLDSTVRMKSSTDSDHLSHSSKKGKSVCKVLLSVFGQENIHC